MFGTIEAVTTAALFVVPGFVATTTFNAVIVRERKGPWPTGIEWLLASLLYWLVVATVVAGVASFTGGIDVAAIQLELTNGQLTPAMLAFIAANGLLSAMVPAIVAWGLGRGLRSSSWLQKLGMKEIEPRAWDRCFSKIECAYAIVTLKDGCRVGGYFGPNSFAASYPNPDDVFFEAVVPLDEAGQFGDASPHSRGAWIPGEEIRIIEFFTALEGEEEDDNVQQERHKVGRIPSTQVPVEEGILTICDNGSEEASTAAERLASGSAQHG